jgi:type IV pilus assembly protein PilW
MSVRTEIHRRAAPRQRGMSIIELMVGIVVAMLVGLAAAGSAIVFTASQRQGIGIGGAGVGAETVVASIKNDVALAGLGFFGDALYLCQNMALSVGTSVLIDGTTFAPLSIGVDGTDHRIDVMYANRVESGANVLLKTASAGVSAELMSLLPVSVGDAVLLAPASGVGTCMVRSVTGVTPSTASTPQVLNFANTTGADYNQAVFSAPPVFVERDRVTMLGDIEWNRYRRIGNTLVLERPMEGKSHIIARNVIGMRAQYGAAAAGSTTLETWEDPAGAFATLTAANLPRVRAIRFGVVTRSPQREKENASGLCEASAAKPQLFGATVEPDVTDWTCYRYTVSTVVVPMRNVVLGLTK